MTNPLTATVDQAAKQCGITTRAIRYHARKKRLSKTYGPGPARRVLYPQSEVNALARLLRTGKLRAGKYPAKTP